MPKSLANALWRIYNRPQRPIPWAYGGNLPWDDAEFSKRMLREHLSQDHGAASRKDEERTQQLRWIKEKLGIKMGDYILDVTCGPGLYSVALAEAGCRVDGVDFGPAAIDHAKQLADERQVKDRVTFFEANVLTWEFPQTQYDHALLLYGQIAVMSRDEAQALLTNIQQALKPGGKLVVELLNQDEVDKKDSNWWYTDTQRLWGDAPFLLLGERQWYADEALSMERFHVVHLESGQLDEVILCDQTYAVDEMLAKMKRAGFGPVTAYPKWDGVPLYDAYEWVVYVAEKE
ncbi:MAG: class I SAM-dependent methyltransferase [Chloroflexota bacterium]